MLNDVYSLRSGPESSAALSLVCNQSVNLYHVLPQALCTDCCQYHLYCAWLCKNVQHFRVQSSKSFLQLSKICIVVTLANFGVPCLQACMVTPYAYGYMQQLPDNLTGSKMHKSNQY